ncbi:MAG: hypothetical protein QF437_13535 [Planctomycetota bacterium]|jgi:hypothetical protein|nr:hypothetical protein [Planctomycetota bacterium]MDP7131512.1 hypothetical protein [Planctomycetota bacterium]MDP7251123.1 hypothetical protein [Planctomycetota bacterium]
MIALESCLNVCEADANRAFENGPHESGFRGEGDGFGCTPDFFRIVSRLISERLCARFDSLWQIIPCWQQGLAKRVGHGLKPFFFHRF